MALLDIKFTWKQRKSLHRYLILGILLNLLIGLILLILGTSVPITLDGTLQIGDRNLLELVFKTIGLYGSYVFAHNLLGVKLCHNYFHHADGSRMNTRLFLWSIMGILVVVVGLFVAGLSSSAVDHLASQIRRSLQEGMKKYLTDVTWKRRIDGIQIRMRCCGVDSFDDWHKTYWLERNLLMLDSPNILEYANVDGRVTPPVVPWSCCRSDVKGPCYHDPLQLPNSERDSTYESLNVRGCLVAMKAVVDGTLYSSVALIALLFVLQVSVTVLSRYDFTAARNAVALGNRWSGSPGWLYGRLDFGNAGGPNLCQIDRVSRGHGCRE